MLKNMPAQDASRVYFAQRDGVLAHTPFGENFTLENFLINKKHVSPLAVAREVTKPQQEQNCNPLMFYGKSGSGKTHILRAIANELAYFYKYHAVFYGSIAKLLQDVNAFGTNGYRVYCIDDIHFFANNIPLQEKFNIFLDACLCEKKQLVCACSDIFYKGLPESLRARLKRGRIVQLKNPDIDVRMRFAQTQCLLHDITISREHLLLLAQRCEHLHCLADVLLKIAAYKKNTQREIVKQDVEKILRSAGDQKSMTPQDIVCRVAEFFSLSPEEITGNRQEHALVFARQTAMYLCREILGTSYPVLGQIFSGKNHSTIIYSIKKIEKYIITNKNKHKKITKLKNICIQEND